jgi:diguanylate cyclase (GGDEF)-like protein
MAAWNLSKRSFRFWVSLGMVLAIAPFLVSAVGGFFILKNDVLDRFDSIMLREFTQVNIIHRLQRELLETTEPVDHYIANGHAVEVEKFRLLRQKIAQSFAQLKDTLKSQPVVIDLIDHAQANWGTGERIATSILSTPRHAGDALGMDMIAVYGSNVTAVVDNLNAADRIVSEGLDRDYAMALHAYGRAEWIAGIAAGISLLFVVAGALIIARMILVNVDRLVEGAERFARGDRDHRIEIDVPPELHKVADEFNYMISQIRKAEQALVEQSNRDPLTGLLNRRSFDEALTEAIARMRRLDEVFALCIVDLDHFKVVNDTHGHAAGDAVLRAVAHTMAMGVREIDKVFRMGGEEFAVILPGVDATDAKAAGERLRSLVAANPVRADTVDVPVTASIGIALSSHALGPARLTEVADKALYRAKEEGRNRVILGEVQDELAHRRTARPTP